MTPLRLGRRLVGPGEPIYVVAEVGINHNGDLDRAKRLIDAAAAAGCDAVKFQKRTVDLVYTVEELAQRRDSPFGTTNGDLKRALEFDLDAYAEIDRHCRSRGIPWFASCWDRQAVDEIDAFEPPCHKVASPCLTDDALLRHVGNTGRPVLLSTGMSDPGQIDHAVGLLGADSLALLHCTSVYPCSVEELNLRVIPWLAARYRVPVGYSGHEVGLATTLAAAVLGACVIERHVTLDRASWGSDQAASVEPHGLARLVKDLRAIEQALGDGVKRIYDSEQAVVRKLRRAGSPSGVS